MTDKIKVWKCEECKAAGSKSDLCISNHRFDCLKAMRWQPTTHYQITERKPTQIDASEIGVNVDNELEKDRAMYGESFELRREDGTRERLDPARVRYIVVSKPEAITIQNQHLHIKGNPGNTTPPSDHTTPPRKRVKIIWSEVNADNVGIAALILDGEHDGAEIDHKTVGLRLKDTECFLSVSDIPKSWLEDIPAEPVSAEALLDKYLPKERMAGGEPREYNDDDVLCIIGYAEANNELRHQPRQSFEEWIGKSYPNWTDQCKIAASLSWKARGKSHGLPDS